MSSVIRRGKVIRGDLALWDGIASSSTRPDASGGTVSGLPVGMEVDVLQVYGAGSNRTRSTLAAALQSIGSAVATLAFSPGTWTIDASITIPSNFTCRIARGCVFNVSSGQTLTFSGPIQRESETWTNGSGTVTYTATNNVLVHQADLKTVLTYFAQTSAETNSSVTPSNYFYPPGHFYRYGAVGDGSTNNAVPWQNMLAQAQQPNGAACFIPATANGFKVNTGVTLDVGPVEIHGEGITRSIVFTTSNIALLEFTITSSRSRVQDLWIQGPGTGASTNAGLLFTNSNSNVLERVRVSAFRYGCYFAEGLNSSYLNRIYDSEIISNGLVNIFAERETNQLQLFGVSFGGGPCARGLYIVDSNSLLIDGGNCEGMTLCAIDIDASTTGSVQMQGHTIIGVDLDGNTSSAGDIRIGNTTAVRGVTIIGGYSNPNTGCDCFINAVRVDGLLVVGHNIAAGYFGGVGAIRRGTVTNDTILLGTVLDGGFSQTISATGKVNYTDAGSLLLDPATDFDAAYSDGSRYNLYKLNSGSLTANKNFYGRLDVARIENSGSPGSGSKLYAAGMLVSDAVGGTNRKGAAWMSGDVDIQDGAVSFGQSAAATAITNGATITTTHVTIARVNPAGAVTGIIMQAGTISGQKCVVLNESANSVTMAASGTSNVADGTGSVVAAKKAAAFFWDSSTSLWYNAN